MATTVVVESRNLIKKFSNKAAVNGVDLEIQRGECFGILGPNGAGKTSLMRMIYCNSPVTSGDLFVLGLNAQKHVRDIKSKIGVVPQEDGLDPDFSVQDNLLVFSRYYGLEGQEAKIRVREMLHFMRLYDYADQPVDTLSGGMKRRLAIARGLIHKPQLLILDEPTTGLDPQARLWIWGRLNDLKEMGTTIILTTHYMEEAQRMCDRIAIMDSGKLLTVDTPKNLIEKHIGSEVVEFGCKKTEQQYYLTRIQERFPHQVMQDRIRLFVGENEDTKSVLEVLPSHDVSVRPATLDDVFLKLSGHDLRD